MSKKIEKLEFVEDSNKKKIYYFHPEEESTQFNRKCIRVFVIRLNEKVQTHNKSYHPWRLAPITFKQTVE